MNLAFQKLRLAVVVLAAACVGLPSLAAVALDKKAAAVLFSPKGGVFGGNVTLKLSTEAGGAIRYTLDGSEPKADSLAYSAPLSIDKTTLVRARAFRDGAPVGAAGGEVYTILDEELAEFSSNLPLVIVNSFGGALTREQRIEGALQCVDGEKERTKLTGALNFSGRCLLNVRGRASLRYAKSSFTVKLIDGEGETAALPVLGMPADADWVLYAPYPDKTLMRDVLAYELHAQMGHWAPRTRFVEVFVNRTGARLSRRDYAGVYVFEERIRRGNHRVDIAKLKPDDDAEPRITGGYIFKKDHTDPPGGLNMGEAFGAGPQSQSTRAGYPTGPDGFPADPAGFLPPARTTSRSSSSSSSRSTRTTRVVTNHFGFAEGRPPPVSAPTLILDEDDEIPMKKEEKFKTSRTNEFFLVEPDPDEATPVQKVWLQRHLNECESALYGEDFRDAKKGFRAFIDPDSFIDYHLIVETTKNADGFRFSVFYHKDRGGKIKADPIWDWNLSFGNCNGKQAWMPEYWLWPQLDNKEYSWYRRLFEDPDFSQRYVDRWAQLRTNVFATKRVLARIDELAGLLDEAQKRNFEKWPILGRAINPNHYIGSSYEDEVNFLKQFTATRLDWIEKQFLPPPGIASKKDGARRTVEFSAPTGRVFFTLDGSDPRASGGEPAAQAKEATAPVPVTSKAVLTARVRAGDRWSAPMVWRE